MRCSDCSAPVRPIVALDIDGTLGNYHGHFLQFAEAYLGPDAYPWLGTARLYSYDGSSNFGDWFQEEYHVTRAVYRDIKLAYRQGGQKRSMPALPGAAELTTKLDGLGVEIWITTSRPYLRLDNIDPDTRHWLKRNRIIFDHAIYSEHKYKELGQLVDRERVVAVLDDLGEMYDEAAEQFGDDVPILKRSRYNADVDRRYVVEDLGAAELLIWARVEQWRINHK